MLNIATKRFSLLELIIAMFILAGSITALLVERQRSLQLGNRMMESSQVYHQLDLALDALERSSLQDEEIEIDPDIDWTMEEISIEPLGVTLKEIMVSSGVGSDTLELRRWVQP
jgi:type II secretory pathway pseudopilin PulG